MRATKREGAFAYIFVSIELTQFHHNSVGTGAKLSRKRIFIEGNPQRKFVFLIYDTNGGFYYAHERGKQIK